MGDIYGKGSKGKATKLHAKIIRSVGSCESCGSTDYLQAAHIVSRRYAATRCDLSNAFCLCARCHRHFEDWPLEFEAFVTSKIGRDAYEVLRNKAISYAANPFPKVDWDDVLAELKAVAKERGIS